MDKALGSSNAYTGGNEKDFDGPIKDRQCRDVIFLIIFAAFTGGLGYVAWRAVSLGNPSRLIYGVDSWGNVCNHGNAAISGVALSGRDMTGKKYLYYFNTGVFTTIADAAGTSVDSVRVCTYACPSPAITSLAEMRNFSTVTGAMLCRYDVAIADYFDGGADGLSSCPHLSIEKHTDFLFRCVPGSVNNKVDHVADAVNSFLNIVDDNFLEKCAHDVENTWKEILLLCMLAVGVALTITLLLQCLAGIIIWLIVFLVIIGSIIACAVCWYHYYDAKMTLDDATADTRTSAMEDRARDWFIGAIAVSVATVILLLILLVLRKHITLVVELFAEAGRAISSMPLILTLPIMTLLWHVGAVVGLGAIFLYIETAGHPVLHQSTGFVEYEADKTLNVLKWYHIFGSIWIVQFISSCHKLAIAGAVATWYFTRNKSTLSLPLLHSVQRIIRYHLGSLALGSLVLTLVVFVRMVLSFIQNRLGGRTHPVATFLLKCLQCCLWCFEKFIKFLNSNAYIEIAIYGYGFCKAAREAFYIIINNVIRLAAINSVGDFVLFLAKMTAVAIVVIVGIQLLSVRDDINYIWLPPTLAGIFAFCIASSFMSVYEVGSQTTTAMVIYKMSKNEKMSS